MAIRCTFFYSCVTSFLLSFIVAIRTIGNELSKVSILFTFQWDGKYKSFYGIRFHFFKGWKESFFWTPFGEFYNKKLFGDATEFMFDVDNEFIGIFGILIMSFEILINVLFIKIFQDIFLNILRGMFNGWLTMINRNLV